MEMIEARETRNNSEVRVDLKEELLITTHKKININKVI
jgi:hypothetical protein